MTKKFCLTILAALALTGCAGSQVKRINELEDHLERVQSLAAKNMRDLQAYERSLIILEKDLFLLDSRVIAGGSGIVARLSNLEKFKAAHDTRWPHLTEEAIALKEATARKEAQRKNSEKVKK